MIWKRIDGYDNYEVSEGGEVRNKKSGRVLKPGPTPKGYMTVCLCKDGKSKTYRVHILVAKAFIPNPNNLPQVNHIDEDKSNNAATNLEWICNQKNVEYSQAGHYMFTNPSGEDVVIFNLSKFCKENGLINGNMFKVLSGEHKSCQGWTNGRRI